tara:strand:- start:2697 stop:2870 length:174 start_codon:yes stop_codon:yes gene_type:complete
MPKPGFKTITVPADQYIIWKKEYQKKRKELRLEGIFSFSAFICRKITKSQFGMGIGE